MELIRGLVVTVRAGRDKGSLQTGLGREGNFLLTADGKRRTLTHPKRRNPLHVWKTDRVLTEEQLRTDRAIRRALAECSDEKQP